MIITLDLQHIGLKMRDHMYCLLELVQIWYGNIPHTEVVQSKSSRHWVKKEGQYFVFPVDETNFPDGVGTYVQQLAQYIPFDTGAIRTALDIGCGVRKLCHFVWFLFCIGLAVNLTVSFLQGKLTFKLKFSWQLILWTGHCAPSIYVKSTQPFWHYPK